MRRRTFLKSTAIGAAASTLAAPAIAQQRRELVMVMTWPKKTPGVGVNAERFVDNVTALTGGGLNIKLYGAGDLVPAFESMEAVSAGTADLCHSTPYYWVGKEKAFNYFTGVPFGLTAQEMAAWINFGGGQALWEEVYEPFGIQPFYAGSSGTQAGGWFRKEVNTPDDFRGLKFRIAGLGGEVLRRMGATTVMVPPGEIAPALMSGAVDGADWIGPWNDLAFGLYRAAKYYYMPGPLEPGPGLEIIANKKVYEDLPPDFQAAIRVAAKATSEETLADFNYHNAVSLEPLISKHGVELRRFSDEILKVMAENSRDVVEELGRTDATTEKVHASFKTFLTQARAYAPRAEGGFLDAREMTGEV